MISSVKLRGVKTIRKAFRVLPKRITRTVLRGALTAAVKPVVKEARKLVPVDEGTLKRSLGTSFTRGFTNGEEINIGARTGRAAKDDGWKAHLLEFGTSPVVIKPKKAKVLAFWDKKKGKLVFTKAVRLRGTKKQPFLAPAMANKGRMALRILNVEILRRIGKEAQKLAAKSRL